MSQRIDHDYDFWMGENTEFGKNPKFVAKDGILNSLRRESL